jgi:hypothetical protein
LRIENFKEIYPSEDEVTARKRIIAALSRIEEEVGFSMAAQMASVPTMFGHWEPDISLLLDVWRNHRADLAIEHLLLSSDIAEVFDASARRTARNRLEAIKRFETMQSEVAAGGSLSSDYTLAQGLLAVCGGRVLWVNMEYSFGDGSCSRTADIEMGFAELSYVQYSQDQHRHLLFCRECQSIAPVTRCVFDEVSSSIFASVRAQLQALNKCLDVSEERSQRLVEIQSEVNEENLDQFIMEARHLLAWRAIELAAYLKLDLSVFLSDISELNPWVRLLRGEGHPSAVAFVQDLNPELLEALFVGLVTSGAFSNDWLWCDKALNGPFCTPTDGDLAPYAWAIELRNTTNLKEWAQILSEPPGGIYTPAMLGILRSGALLELSKAIKSPEPTRLTDDIQQQLDRIESLVGNGNALQMPILELLDKLVALSSAPSAERAEENLQKYLGAKVFNGLAREPRQYLIGAEYCFIDRKSPLPLIVIMGIAVAFERQLELAVDRPLQVEIGKLRADVDLTNVSRRPGPPARRQPHEENMGLMRRLELALQDPEPLQQRALSNLGLDARKILEALRNVRLLRNQVMHGTIQMSYEDVRRRREIWYGLRPGTPSIFWALVPFTD